MTLYRITLEVIDESPRAVFLRSCLAKLGFHGIHSKNKSYICPGAEDTATLSVSDALTQARRDNLFVVRLVSCLKA